MRYFSENSLNSLPLMRFVTECGPMHSHKFYEIAVFVNEKSYNNELNGKKTRCPPLYCIILRPNIDCHYIEHDNYYESAHIDIYVPKKKMQDICNMIKTNDGTPFIDILMKSEQIPQFSLSQQAVSFIQGCLYAQDFWPISTEKENIHSSIIFIILSEYYAYLQKKPRKQSDIVNQVSDLLKNPYNFNTHLENILKQLPYSRTYINKEFKKYTNNTLIAYFDNQKILYASMLLINTDDTILSIANAVGFSSPKNFIKQFKKVFGCYPSEYRKNQHLFESE